MINPDRDIVRHLLCLSLLFGFGCTTNLSGTITAAVSASPVLLGPVKALGGHKDSPDSRVEQGKIKAESYVLKRCPARSMGKDGIPSDVIAAQCTDYSRIGELDIELVKKNRGDLNKQVDVLELSCGQYTEQWDLNSNFVFRDTKPLGCTLKGRIMVPAETKSSTTATPLQH